MYESIKIMKDDLSPAYIRRLNELFHRDIREHLGFEENQLFPMLVNKGKQEAQDIISVFEAEHKDIRDKINKFDQEISRVEEVSYTCDLSGVMDLSRSIIEMLIAHARKEDNELYPLMKKLGIKL